MAKWGKVDYKALQDFQKKIEKMATVDYDAFCEECAKEIAARLLARVIKRTPVGKYPKGSEQKGGTLRRGWTSSSDKSAMYNNLFGGAKELDDLAVEKKGSSYEVTIVNPVEYASYVEFGHRTNGGKGFVNGQYFMTISENEIRREMPAFLERKLMQKLSEVF